MRLSLRVLFGAVLLAAVATAAVMSRYAPIHLSLGMDHARVERLLRHVGAEDISAGMSTYAVVVPCPDGTTSADYPAPDIDFNPTGMWHISGIGLTVETEFDEEKLTEINVWDWTGRELNSYHHTLEFDSVSELIIPVGHLYYRATVLETHNKGVNPPIKSGG